MRSEIASLSEHVESRAAEIRRLQSTVESYKLSNDELNVSPVLRRDGSRYKLTTFSQRALTVASAGVEDGVAFAHSAKELERNRKAHEIQFAEFEIIKKSLMKDLQNRCEKVSLMGDMRDALTS